MEWLRSFWLLIKRSFRRWWPFAAFWLLDMCDLYERYAKSHIPTEAQVAMEWVLQAGPFVVIGGVLWAIVCTYHDLRMNNKTLNAELVPKLEMIVGNSEEFEKPTVLAGDPIIMGKYVSAMLAVIPEEMRNGLSHLPPVAYAKVIKVQNTSAKVAKSCRIQMSDTTLPLVAEGTSTPRDLAWFPQNTVKLDIPGGGEGYGLAVLTRLVTKDDIRFPDGIFPWSKGSSATVTVVAWAEGSPTVRRRYRIEMGEGWYPIVHELHELGD